MGMRGHVTPPTRSAMLTLYTVRLTVCKRGVRQTLSEPHHLGVLCGSPLFATRFARTPPATGTGCKGAARCCLTNPHRSRSIACR